MGNWSYSEVRSRIYLYRKLEAQYKHEYADAQYGNAYGYSNNYSDDELSNKAYEIGWHYGRCYKHGIDIPDYILAKDDV